MLLALYAARWWSSRDPVVQAGPSGQFTPVRQDNRPSPGFSLIAALVPTAGTARVRLTWSGIPEQVRELSAYRSTRALEQTQLDEARYPISRTALAKAPWDDDRVADNATYHYQLVARLSDGTKRYSTVASVSVPDRRLQPLSAPAIFVDKLHYLLELRDGTTPAKRYPIALGRNPRRRKLHQDNASTPEGVYRILQLQPQATFYRAYDLDYPNESDHLRYEVARQAGRLPAHVPSIGGEIQIHGRGIDASWTFGCIALRNTDMDELFSRPEIATGTSVRIVGSELTQADLEAMKAARTQPAAVREAQGQLRRLGFYQGTVDGRVGQNTMRALGLFQLGRDLPLSCDLDARTLEALERAVTTRR